MSTTSSAVTSVEQIGKVTMLNISNVWFSDLKSLPHHSEPGDPTLLFWIIEAIDRFIGFGPYLMLALLSCLVISIPLTIVLCLRLFSTEDHHSNGDPRQ